MILTVRLPPREARALAEMCRRFRFDDAQALLSGARNVSPSQLCEAITNILNALDATSRLPAQAEAGPMVTAESDTRVTVSIAVDKADLARHRRFLEMLIALAPER
jgi:hypothetical protein